MSGIEGFRPIEDIVPAAPLRVQANSLVNREQEEATVQSAIRASALARADKIRDVFSPDKGHKIDRLLNQATNEILHLSTVKMQELRTIESENANPRDHTEEDEVRNQFRDGLSRVINRISSSKVFSNFNQKGKERLFRGWMSILEMEWRHPGDLEKPSLELHLDCVKEQIFNQIVNRECFFKEAHEFIKEHQRNILQEMGVHVSRAHFISFKMKLAEGGDSHNGGKIPLQVKFSWVEGLTRKHLTVYYKPRSAKADKIIIDAWGELEKRGMENVPKPYKIISFSENECSIWENIPGTVGDRKKYLVAESYIDHMELDESTREIALKKFRVLHGIAEYLGITDLHSENCIFQEDGTVVLIDLEVIHEGADTVLLKDPAHKPEPIEFTSEQKEILDKSKIELKKNLVRFLPMATEYFDGLLYCYSGFYHRQEGRDLPMEVLIKSMEERGYLPIGNMNQVVDKLRAKMLIDFFNYDVSFFSLNPYFVYIGGKELEDCRIGERFVSLV